MQSNVYKKYEVRQRIGIKATTPDPDTGEVVEHILINAELTADAIKQGYYDFQTIYTHYGSDKKYEDSFEPIETATIKMTKQKKKTKRSKKE